MTSQATPDLSRLPALPQTLIELIDACNNSEVDIYSVGSLVARDVTISARIIQLANSAFLGTKAAFTEIEQAVIYLGIDTVRNLAVSVSVYEAFSSERSQPHINLEEFWYHSLLTAIISKSLAERVDYPNPAEAYLAGLLHDIGKLLMAVEHQEQYVKLQEGENDSIPSTELELRLFGYTHAEAGAVLAHHWSIEESIALAIEKHHGSAVTDQQPGLPNLLVLADKLSKSDCAKDEFAEYSEQLELTLNELHEINDAAASMVEEIAQALGIAVSRPVPDDRTYGSISARADLTDKVGELAAVYGCLDNLLKAHDRNRISQVIEESLAILFGIELCLILIHDQDKMSSELLVANTSSLFMRKDEFPLSTSSAAAFVAKCVEHQGAYTAASKQNSDPAVDEDQLINYLGSEALLVVPMPIDSRQTALLVAGVNQDKLNDIAASPALLLLGSHGGARLQLERTVRHQAEEIASRELRAVETVARSVAHEISNPLAIIQNYLVVLESKIQNPDIAHDINIVHKEIDRISVISRQLENIRVLDMNEKRPTDRLDHLIKDILNLFRQTVFAEKKIETTIKLQPESRVQPVYSDLLSQVLTILFTNAAEAMPNGGRVTISSAIEPQSSAQGTVMLRISVSDTGTGVAPEIADTIFHAGVTTKTEGHLGLGLSIARKRLADIGGALVFEKPEEGGARFIATMPLQDYFH